MLASWCGTHFKVVQVLHEVHASLPLLNQLKLTCPTYHTIQVIDNILKDHGTSDQEVYNCAQGLLLLGAIFKSTRPDELVSPALCSDFLVNAYEAALSGMGVR